jgi:hypothetical protein
MIVPQVYLRYLYSFPMIYVLYPYCIPWFFYKDPNPSVWQDGAREPAKNFLKIILVAFSGVLD